MIETTDQAPPEYDPADDPHYEALEKTGFFGYQAAGALIIARRTGRMLLQRRSTQVLQPGDWGCCSGAHHDDELPEDAARREMREETGWNGPDEDVEIHPAYVFSSGDFVFRNHIAIIDDEFEPLLGWESDKYIWCTRENLPDPLHFGIAALLADPTSLDIISKNLVGAQNG